MLFEFCVHSFPQVGGIQMVVGIMMKIFNAIHFRDTLTLCFEAIPQLIFMLAFVGFMDFLIIFKWATPISVTPSNKPSIISNIIEMCMFSPIKIRMFSGQETVHKASSSARNAPVKLTNSFVFCRTGLYHFNAAISPGNVTDKTHCSSDSA